MHKEAWAWSTRNGAPRGTEDAVDNKVERGMRLFDTVMKEYAWLEIERRRWDARMNSTVERVKRFYTSEYRAQIDNRAIGEFKVGVMTSVSGSQNRMIDYFSETVNREFVRLPRLSMAPAYVLLFKGIRAKQDHNNRDFIDMLIATTVLRIADSGIRYELQARFDVDASPALVPPGAVPMRSENGPGRVRQTP